MIPDVSCDCLVCLAVLFAHVFYKNLLNLSKFFYNRV